MSLRWANLQEKNQKNKESIKKTVKTTLYKKNMPLPILAAPQA